jgi:hypothetical protein
MLPFVEATEDHGGKGDGPDPIGNFFEGDRFVGQGNGDKQRPAPGDVAILIDPANFRMARILQRRQAARQRTRRGMIVRRRHGLVQGFMRPLVVVLGAETGEASLLGRRSGGGGPRGVGFEDAVKLFVRPVLFGVPGIDALGHNPEADPPDRQGRQAPEARPPKRGPIVTANPKGRPYSANARSKRGRVTARVCAVRASQRSTKRLKPSRSVNG